MKNAVEFIGKYEEVVAKAAGERGVDGVVCGHIHTAEFRNFEFEGKRVEYWNDGDWVEGCNALVEHHDGRMEILNWPDIIKARKTQVMAQEAVLDEVLNPHEPGVKMQKPQKKSRKASKKDRAREAA